MSYADTATFCFIMSYLRKLLSAAARAGLPPRRQRSILKEVGRYFERMPEEELNKCFLRLEETRVEKLPDLRKAKTLSIVASDVTLNFNVETSENGEIRLVPREGAEPTPTPNVSDAHENTPLMICEQARQILREYRQAEGQ